MPESDYINNALSLLKKHEDELVNLIRVVKNSEFSFFVGQYESALMEIRKSISSLTETINEE